MQEKLHTLAELCVSAQIRAHQCCRRSPPTLTRGRQLLDAPLVTGAPDLSRLERVQQIGMGAFGHVIQVPRLGHSRRGSAKSVVPT